MAVPEMMRRMTPWRVATPSTWLPQMAQPVAKTPSVPSMIQGMMWWQQWATQIPTQEMPSQELPKAPIDSMVASTQMPQTQVSDTKMSRVDFAKRIKQQYPEYKDMDDLELTNKILAKFPEYVDMVAEQWFEPRKTTLKEKAAVVWWALLWSYSVWQFLESIGKSLYWLTLPPNIKEAWQIQRFEAWLTDIKPRQLIETALDAPLLQKWGRTLTSKLWLVWTREAIWTQALARANNIFKDVINPIFDTIQTQYNYWEIMQKAKDAILADPRYSQEYAQEIIWEIDEFAKEFVWNTTLKNIDKVKSELANKLPAKYFTWQPVTQALQQARWAIANAMRTLVHSELTKASWIDTAQQYLDYANLKWLAEVGKKSMTEGWRKWWAWSLVSWIFEEMLTPVSTISWKLIHKTWRIIGAVPKLAVDLIKKAPELIKKASRSWWLVGALVQLGITPWLPVDVATKAMEMVNEFNDNPKSFIPMEWGIYQAIKKEEYDRYKNEDGSIDMPDWLKYKLRNWVLEWLM
jgi:hypothetical protein